MKPSMEMTDSRRLTGANLLTDQPGAVLDIAVDCDDAGFLEKVTRQWQQQARILLDRLDWGNQHTFIRRFKGGASLMITAPRDALFAATEVNEAAWEATEAEINQQPGADLDETLERLRRIIAEESSEPLLALRQAALDHGVSCLADEDEVSVGMGKSSRCWPLDSLPDPASIDWQAVQDIPVVMITGTNGKSTCTRLLASILNQAGRCAGMTSTDYIQAGDRIVDRGDYSGPQGARTLLRHQDLEVAVLETARGGLLRRGLPIEHANVAVITNVAEDHLGGYGVNTLDDLLATKFLVTGALGPSDVLVLNADDEGIREYASGLEKEICWFTTDPRQRLIEDHIEAGGRACYLTDNHIHYIREGVEESVASVEDIPICMEGRATFNVRNAMAVTAAAEAIGVSVEKIRSGLIAFENTVKNNPGRGNFFSIGHATVLLDFAHNAHGMSALMEMVNQIPATRHLVMLGHAGDRSDDEIAAMTTVACSIQPQHIVVTENPANLRGRPLGEVSEVIVQAVRSADIPESRITRVNTPLEGVQAALAWSKPGDLLILQVLQDRDKVVALLEQEARHSG